MNTPQSAGASRFRLRFMLQQFELSHGDTFIGRSEDCQVTIFDPLVSRRHARIRVIGEKAVLEDLGSRNGCRVNGTVIRAPHSLSAGDRIRIGKHELVFTEIPAVSSVPRERQTGSLVFCASCDTVYSLEMGMCPSCWSRDALNDDTRSGSLDEHGKESWAVDLLLELFRKAVSSNRTTEADRVLRQIMGSLEAQLTAGARLEAERLEPVATAAVQLAQLQVDGFWVHWAADFYGRAGVRVPQTVAGAQSDPALKVKAQK